MSKHILILDDEAQIRELLVRAFQSKGFRATAVGTGREAIQSAGENPPDLIISDLQLNESDGLEVIDQLKRLQPDVPVMLVTGVLLDSDEVRAVAGGRIAAYVEKTAPLKRVIDEARRLLGETVPHA